MSINHLFRKEVFDHRKHKNHGSVFINVPFSLKAISFGLFFLMVGICGFLYWGEYSEQFEVQGYLESSKGLVRVYANKRGIVQKSYVVQGDRVKQGEPLVWIDTFSDIELQQGHDDVLEQLRKNKQTLDVQLRYKKHYLHALHPLLKKKFISLSTYQLLKDEISRLEHQKNTLQMEIIQHRHQKISVIRAPMDSRIASVMFHAGQNVDTTKPLMKLIPSEAHLEANLFIPVDKSGFIQKNDLVTIRYDAYPFTRFGTAKARIQTIDQSILTDDEENNPIRMGQPYYKAIAILEKQSIQVYGREKKIQQGMTLSAVMMGSKRKIWQWIFDPVFSFYGGILD